MSPELRSGEQGFPDPFRGHAETHEKDRAADKPLQHLLAETARQIRPQVTSKDGGRNDHQEGDQGETLSTWPQKAGARERGQAAD